MESLRVYPSKTKKTTSNSHTGPSGAERLAMKPGASSKVMVVSVVSVETLKFGISRRLAWFTSLV